jgi:sugar/nucleoside kinase (ribokinase family)
VAAEDPRGGDPVVVCLGAHIVDILGRPVPDLPEGQGRHLLEEIRITAAGTAAGTGVDLARLGHKVISMGAIGDDLLADVLVSVLQGHGVDTSRLVRRAGVQTSATMLPIRPNGDRPALHCPGATPSLGARDVDASVIADADLLHIGAPDVLGSFAGRALTDVLDTARAHGTTVTLDILTPGSPETWTRMAPVLARTDYFLPNADQLRNLTGEADLGRAAGVALDAGALGVLVSDGAAGARLATETIHVTLPAFDVPVVDTTGCGDAVSAGFISGILRGLDEEASAWLAMAAAALVVQGLGSDAGIVDLDGTLALLAEHAPAAVVDRAGRALVAPRRR